MVGLTVVAVLGGSVAVTGRHTSTDPIIENSVNVNQVARTIFIDYVFALEITAALLTIAVVGAVVLTRRARPEGSDDGSGV